MTRSLPATIALPPSAASMLATRMKRGELRRSAGRAARNISGCRGSWCGSLPAGWRGSSLERAHQHHRPFDEAGDLVEQAVVLDQLEALREGKVLGFGRDDLAAPLRIDDDIGFFAASPRSRRSGAPRSRAGARKRWPKVTLPALRPSTSNGTISGSSVSGPKVATIECSGRTQRERAGLRRRRAPAHRFRPREGCGRCPAGSRRSPRSRRGRAFRSRAT